MGRCSLTRSRPLPSAPTIGVSDPEGPQPGRPVNLSLRAPTQMGWRKMEHKREMRLVLSRTRGCL
jgi:hypothetical protein